MNINKRGFATSTILFSLLSLFLIAISILLFTMNSSTNLNKSLNDKTVENIEYGSTNINNLEITIEELQSQVDNLKSEVIDQIYPVGSIYISATESTVEEVQARFGGTWIKYSEGTALVGIGTYTDKISGNVTTYSKDATGGTDKVTLTTSNLPSHTHSFIPNGSITSEIDITSETSSAGSHTHTLTKVLGWPTKGDGSTSNYAYSGWASTTGVYSSSVSGTNSAGSHTHNVTVKGNVSSKWAPAKNQNTGSTGSGTSFSVQNPYTAVYIYKRTK